MELEHFTTLESAQDNILNYFFINKQKNKQKQNKTHVGLVDFSSAMNGESQYPLYGFLSASVRTKYLSPDNY